MDEWRDIPGFSRYQVKGTGELRRVKDGVLLGIRESKTTVGTYMTAAVINNSGKRLTDYSFHRLICLAFHGLPPSEKHTDANHKDGDKHNNHPDNLEWCTRSENVLHAYQTGLRKDSRKVIMTDHETGVTHVFFSMAELARWAGLKHLKGWHFAQKYTDIRYMDRYTFKVSDDYKVPKRKHTRSVYALDMSNRKLHVFENLGELELKINILRGTAQTILRKPLNNRVFNGYALWHVGDKIPEFINAA